ncbi:MAG: glycosyltransferase [Alkalibacterium sp.]|nr:glycosyltransferase [Alkalibacterium sp.]
MKVSAILPVFNVGEYLPKCIESLLDQNYDDYEIILVNDGSTDNSREICEYYETLHDHVILINQENKGSGVARNTGLSKASGDYIFFCDPDDYISGNFFKKVEEVTIDSPDLVIFGYWDEFRRKNKVKSVSLTFDKEEKMMQGEFREAFSDLFKKKVLYTLWNKVYKKSFLADYQFTFESAPMGQDTRFNLAIYKEVKVVKIVPDQFYHYVLERPGSSTHKYRENLLSLKMGELEKLTDLLEYFDTPDEELIQQIKSDILVSSCNNCVNSELTLKNKRNKIVTMLGMKEFENIKNTHHMNPVNKFFLTKRYVRTYIVFKLIYNYVLSVKG